MLGSRRTENEALVAEAMQELARAPHDSSCLPDPSFIWWKAQFLRRLDAEREATAPLDVGKLNRAPKHPAPSASTRNRRRPRASRWRASR